MVTSLVGLGVLSTELLLWHLTDQKRGAPWRPWTWLQLCSFGVVACGLAQYGRANHDAGAKSAPNDST